MLGIDSILFAFGAMFCWGVGDYFIQKSARKVGDIDALFWNGLIGAIILLPFALPQLPLLFTTANLITILLVGVVTFVAALIYFEALKEGKLSVSEVLFEIELPITAILGVVLLNQILSPTEIIIITIIFAGIILIAIKDFTHLKALTKLEKGAIYAVLAGIGMAGMNYFIGVGAREISPILVIWAPWVIFTLLCIPLIHKNQTLHIFFRNSWKNKSPIFWMSILETMAWLFFAFAIVENKIAVILAITESYPAIGVILGIAINKEKLKKHQILGAIIAIAASVFMAVLV